MSDKELELINLISDYQTYRAIAQSSISGNPYHSYYQDFSDIVKRCDDKLIYLYIELKSLLEE